MSQPGLNRREMLALLGAVAAPQARADGGLLQATRIEHFGLTVPDIAKSMSFYRALFGNEVLKDSASERRYLRLGPCYLAIAPPTRPEQTIRIDHLSVGVSNYNGASIKASLEKAGIEVRESKFGLFVADPDGTSVQIWSDDSWNELDNAAPEAVTGPEPLFRSRGMHHMAIRVSDAGRSAEFYAKLFGPGTVGPGDPPRPRLQAGESGVILYPPVAGKTPDVDHFSVLVDPFDPVAAVAKLQALGANAKLSQNGTLPEFFDPDGIRLQVTPLGG